MLNELWTEIEFIEESSLGLSCRRKNIYLLNIDKRLREYGKLSKESFAEEADKLLLICKACKIYVDNKPAGHRAAAVITLYAQALNRVEKLASQRVTGQSLGYGQEGWAKVRAVVKPLLNGVAGSNGKAHHILDEEYWPEMIVENHFPLTHPIFDTPSPLSVWKNSSTHLNFIDWLRELYIPDMLKQNSGPILMYKLDKGVSYLNSAQREDKKIYVKNGIIYNSRHEEFHTGNMKTASMGKGWAIFVMAPDNSLYANNHKTDVFHHSSFLSGAPVQSAGEIAVDNGKVVAITSKSGHYRPDKGSFVRILYWLKQHGVNLQGIAACLAEPGHKQQFFDAAEVWANGGLPGVKYIEPRRVTPT